MRAQCLALCAIFISTVVISPLDKLRTESRSAMPVKPHLITPLGKMPVPENVLVVGAPPNEHHWGEAGMWHALVNDLV